MHLLPHLCVAADQYDSVAISYELFELVLAALDDVLHVFSLCGWHHAAESQMQLGEETSFLCLSQAVFEDEIRVGETAAEEQV